MDSVQINSDPDHQLVQRLQAELTSKQEVIDSMRESLKSVTAYKNGTQGNQNSGDNSSGHFRQLSLSDKPPSQDEAER